MAIRYREGRSTPWQVYWNNPHTGKRESASFLTEHEAKKEDSLVKHRLRFDRESFSGVADEQNLYGKGHQQQENTLDAVYLQYLRTKQFDKKGVQWQMDCMRTPLSLLGHKDVAEITSGDVSAVIEALTKKGTKAITVRIRAAAFRAVLRWAEDQDFMGHVRFPKLPSVQCEKFIPPTTEEIGALLAVSPSHIQRVIILGSQLGVRVGPCELLRLTWKDVDFSQSCLVVHGSKKNKAQPWRIVPIRESLLPIFHDWKKEDGGDGPIVHYKGVAVTSIKKAWATALRNAGIERKIRPYDLRHAFATEAIAAGVDVGTVSKLMGHSTPTMVLKHYQHVMDSQKRAAVEALPDVPHVPKTMCPTKRHLQ